MNLDQIAEIPLSLYIHIPWCVKKCPYCDFNSHPSRGALPEKEYVDALIRDFESQKELIQGRSIHSIFFGGGTPSLFSAQSINRLLSHIFSKVGAIEEITLEANPGTFEQAKFRDFRSAGINRLSVGVQSFNAAHLKALGRIHDSNDAKTALAKLNTCGFDNWNLDLMVGLPNQTLEEALEDLQTALDFNPPHLSWYQLTLEPNTLFHKYPPPLPEEEVAYHMHTLGHERLAEQGYLPYEVSAFTKERPCLHNLNYWTFGDYLGIGAGAHAKITTPSGILRQTRIKHPKGYLDPNTPFIEQVRLLSETDLLFEFMLNALRLSEGFDLALWKNRTTLSENLLYPTLKKAETKGLIVWQNNKIKPTDLGKLYLNDLMEMFLPDDYQDPIPNHP